MTLNKPLNLEEKEHSIYPQTIVNPVMLTFQIVIGQNISRPKNITQTPTHILLLKRNHAL
jgi:hypothetical protein